jgi:hypothetical protein
MKKISLVLAMVFSVLISTAQTWTKVNGRWEYQYMRFDNTVGTFTPPQDTLASAPVGSIAVKNDTPYFKTAAGTWLALVGGIFANNGVSKDEDTIKFGQSIGAIGSPAALNSNREVPLNGFNIGFNGNGRIGIGTNNPDAKFDIKDTVLSNSSTSSIRCESIWNTTGTPTAFFMNVTNTASNSASKIMDIKQDGTTRFSIDRGAGAINLLSSGARITGAGGAAGGISFGASVPAANNILGTTGLSFSVSSTPSQQSYSFSLPTGYMSPTSGNYRTLSVSNGSTTQGFTPTSGTAELTVLDVVPGVNQTGTASGITRGLRIDSTNFVTASLFKCIDLNLNKSNHYGIYQSGSLLSNLFNGSVTIGAATTNTDPSKLIVNGRTTSNALKLTNYTTSGDGSHSGATLYGRRDTIPGNQYGYGLQEYSFVWTNTNFRGYVGVQSWPYITGAQPGGVFGKFAGYVTAFSAGPIWDGSFGGSYQLPTMINYFSALQSQSGGVDKSYDLYASEINSVGGTTLNPTVNEHYAVYAEPFSYAVRNYGIYINGNQSNYFGGKLWLGSKTDTAHKLNVTGTAKITDTLKLFNVKSISGNYSLLVHSLTDSGTYQLPIVGFSQTSTGSATNTTTETTLTSTGDGSLTLPVEKMTAGKTYKLSARGMLSTDPSSSSTFNFRVKMGGTTIAATGNIFIGTNISNRAWVADVYITIRTNGASGTVMVMGMYEDSNSNHTPLNNGTSTTTIDMTSSKALDFTVQMGSAAAGTTAGAYILTLEEIH